MLRIGLISDTHGLLRPEALSFLRGSDHIVHAGDICDPSVLDRLATIAPVTAVRGNNDRGAWAEALRTVEYLTLGGVTMAVVHDLPDLDVDPQAAGLRAVISGHSHQPTMAERDGVLYLNPGSAGPRRFKLPVSVGELQISGDAVSGKLVELMS
ncbi:metallophosphoesterase family protein [Ideonella sp.]|uniref:metallophosphoesterase family protein n=1 Tax=Ideonella sp. TaxID=1929293 RepID=UPI002C62FF2E|nr:metallophosphoesterase family protein [Ramlibacter sp.]